MASFPISLLSSLLLFLLTLLTTSKATLHRAKLLTSELSADAQPSSPTTFFEVTRPITLPKTKPCSILLLQHDFGSTYSKPPVTVIYEPPSHCPFYRPPSAVVLEWSGACRGRQFDRIFGVWLGGVELLRSCTAEPRDTGMVWTVKKDVTRYSSLFAQPNLLAVYLGNIVDQTFTGVYHVNISLHFFFDSSDHRRRPAASHVPDFASPADLILPISRSLPLNDGLWFPVQNSSDIQKKKLAVPTNTYRAILEVYVSFHQRDEFWYGNPPNDYILANNLTDMAGNGPFREVTARLDGEVVGAIWPFTVIYTGGVNPLLWRPITAIGSYDLPSYDIEITPLLGKILDGKVHEFGFGVTDALDVWYIDANLHLWLDSKSSYTVGNLIKYEAPDFMSSLVSKFKGLDGRFKTTASRKISMTGWVKSSYGNITTHFFQRFDYENQMQFAANGSIQVVKQTIDFNHGIYTKLPSSILYLGQVHQKFPLYIYTKYTDQVDDAYTLASNVTLGFNEKKFSGGRFGFSFSSLRNLQNSHGYIRVWDNLVSGGSGSTQQVYRFESTGGCYFRNVSSSNYTILHDETGKSCAEASPLGTELFLAASARWPPFSSEENISGN